MEEEDRTTVLGRGMIVTINDLHEMDTIAITGDLGGPPPGKGKQI